MTIDVQQVQPGDLITASFFNDLIEQLVALDTRLAKLEGSTSSATVIITSVDKSVVHIDEDITIKGQNFGFSVGACRVRFDGFAPAGFGLGSSDGTVICKVPAMPTLPPGGGKVTLSVTNLTLSGPGATASRPITVLPAPLPQSGNVDLVLKDVKPDPLTAGVANEFRFDVQSDAALPTVVTFAAHCTIAGVPALWATSLLDGNLAPLAGGQLSLQPAETKSMVVRVAIPANANNTSFTLLVDGQAPGLTPASAGLAPMTVGLGADPDPTFTLSPNASAALSGATINANAGQIANITVESVFTVAGKYDVKLATLAGTTGWASAITAPAGNPPVIDITAANLADGQEARTVAFRVQPSAGASDPGQLRLTVQRSGESRSRSFTFDLNVA